MLYAVAEEGSRAARDGAVAGRMPGDEAGGEEAFETVGEWFKACVMDHGSCRFGGEGSLVEGGGRGDEVVDLPHPDGPSKQVTCPGITRNDTSSTTARPPK